MGAKPDRKVEKFFGDQVVRGLAETLAFLGDEFEYELGVRAGRELAIEAGADLLDGKTIAVSRDVFYDMLGILDTEHEGTESDDDGDDE